MSGFLATPLPSAPTRFWHRPKPPPPCRGARHRTLSATSDTEAETGRSQTRVCPLPNSWSFPFLRVARLGLNIALLLGKKPDPGVGILLKYPAGIGFPRCLTIDSSTARVTNACSTVRTPPALARAMAVTQSLGWTYHSTNALPSSCSHIS